MLPDGRYDVFVVDATPDAETGGTPYVLELTIVAGDHKGDVLALRSGAELDPLDVLGLPGTLVVDDGRPHLDLDR